MFASFQSPQPTAGRSKLKGVVRGGKPATMKIGNIGNGGLLGRNAGILRHQEKCAHSLLVSILPGASTAREGGKILGVSLGLVD